MQLGNGIYHSSVHQKLNMFRVICRSSTGAPTAFTASGPHTHAVTARSQVWVGTDFPLTLDYGRSPHAYVNQRLQKELGLLMMSDIPLETCWAFNEVWNNKFRYQVAYCWLLLLSQFITSPNKRKINWKTMQTVLIYSNKNLGTSKA